MADFCGRCGGKLDTGKRCLICGVGFSPPRDNFYSTKQVEEAMESLTYYGAEDNYINTSRLTGLSSSYYTLPEGCKELQDLIEYKNMNFARGNMFKAVYRLGDKPGTETIYDLEKIIWFAQREIERIKNETS